MIFDIICLADPGLMSRWMALQLPGGGGISAEMSLAAVMESERPSGEGTLVKLQTKAMRRFAKISQSWISRRTFV